MSEWRLNSGAGGIFAGYWFPTCSIEFPAKGNSLTIQTPGRSIRPGEMAERPIAPVLKTGVPSRVPRVRIPVSPLPIVAQIAAFIPETPRTLGVSLRLWALAFGCTDLHFVVQIRANPCELYGTSAPLNGTVFRRFPAPCRFERPIEAFDCITFVMALCRARAQHRGARARARRYDHSRSPPAMDGTRHPEKAKSTQKKRCEPPAISEEARTLLQHSITITSTVALSTSTIKNGMTVPPAISEARELTQRQSKAADRGLRLHHFCYGSLSCSCSASRCSCSCSTIRPLSLATSDGRDSPS